MDFKHLIFEDDDKPSAPKPSLGPATRPLPSIVLPPSTPQSTVFVPTQAYSQPATDDPNTFLDRLKTKTDFDTTPVGQQLKDHLAPLDGLPLTDTQKMTAALKAGAKEGLTGAAVVSVLQGLLTDQMRWIGQ